MFHFLLEGILILRYLLRRKQRTITVFIKGAIKTISIKLLSLIRFVPVYSALPLKMFTGVTALRSATFMNEENSIRSQIPVGSDKKKRDLFILRIKDRSARFTLKYRVMQISWFNVTDLTTCLYTLCSVDA